MVAKATLIGFTVGTALVVAVVSSQAMARGGAHSEDPWAAAHIDGLPAEVRQVISRQAQACGAKLAAQHAFTRSISAGNTRLIAVHYEHTNCANRGALCTGQGCLHQVYVSTGRGYRLVLSVHAPEIELKLLDKSPAVAVECPSESRCARTLIWNGSRFVSHGM